MNFDALKIINNLILQYRNQLTNGEMNACGGFKLKDDFSRNDLARIKLTYEEATINVLHLYGNVYGFLIKGNYYYVGDIVADFINTENDDKLAT